MVKPLVSVIIPVASELTLIQECLLSLFRQTYPKDRFSIIVVIDAQGDPCIKGDLDALGAQNLTVVQNTGHGSASARNLGVSLADKKTNYFAFTDADCIVSETWLEVLVKHIEDAVEPIGCVGGINLTPKNDPAVAQVIGCLEQTLLGGGGSAQGSVISMPMVVASIPNCNALYRAAWWQKNKQDEDLIIGQDGEFNYRLAKQGCRFVIVPGAVVWHHRPSKVARHIRRMYFYGVATAHIFRKHPGILYVRWYALPPAALLVGTIMLTLLGLILPVAWLILAIGLGIYAVLVLLTTIEVAMRSGRFASTLTILLLPCQHMAYAFGFLYGFF